MHLALVIDDYLPHSTRVGAKMFHELAVELIRQGHQVTVITPQFTNPKTFYKSCIDGVTVWYFRSGPIKDTKMYKRALNETLLSFRAWQAIKWECNEVKFDGVVYYSPSIFFGGLISKIRGKFNCRSYLVLRDFFPQWAIDYGIIKESSLVSKYFRFFEQVSYRQADKIGVMSDANLINFNKINKGRFSVEVLYNWANLQSHVVTKEKKTIRDKLSLHDRIIFFYGGNIGKAQDMANLMRLARSMQMYPKAHFLFIGQGDEVELVKHLALEWNLTNFDYFPSVSQDEFKEILASIDVGLFSLSAHHKTHNFPGKLLGYMAYSIPILGSVNDGNDLMPIINNCEAGLITLNGDDKTLFEHAVRLYNDESIRKKIGENAFTLLAEKFSVQNASDRILMSLRNDL